MFFLLWTFSDVQLDIFKERSNLPQVVHIRLVWFGIVDDHVRLDPHMQISLTTDAGTVTFLVRSTAVPVCVVYTYLSQSENLYLLFSVQLISHSSDNLGVLFSQWVLYLALNSVLASSYDILEYCCGSSPNFLVNESASSYVMLQWDGIHWATSTSKSWASLSLFTDFLISFSLHGWRKQLVSHALFFHQLFVTILPVSVSAFK